MGENLIFGIDQLIDIDNEIDAISKKYLNDEKWLWKTKDEWIDVILSDLKKNDKDGHLGINNLKKENLLKRIENWYDWDGKEIIEYELERRKRENEVLKKVETESKKKKPFM